ncbi:MAG: DUF1015 domain-containing protein [Clostridiales bacterium]|nr:DUF1015 domain-containing protein [Clostridiales bacterium]
MINLKAFKGVRYTLDNIADVVTPPYDVISDTQQDEYYALDPYNIIRLELGKEYEGDGESNNKYTRAAAKFNAWLEEDILHQDEEDSLYVYEQKFKVDGVSYSRTGLVGLVKLEEFSKGNILPHENTLSKPKVDRLNLMRACNANFSQVFALYDDGDKGIGNIIYKYKNDTEPDIQFESSESINESLWKLSDPDIIKDIEGMMSDKKLFIADGHHRYETALAYRDEQINQNPNHTGDEEYNYVMMVLVATNDPGLVVLPTHRCINNIDNFSADDFLAQVGKEFDTSKHVFKSTGCEDRSKEIEQLLADSGNNAYAFYDGNGSHFYILKLKDISLVDSYLPGRKTSYKVLDVTILHTLILDNILGIGPKELANQENISYTHNFKEGYTWVEEGQEQFVFFVNPTAVDQVKNVALDEEKMPQKSTYFYPKLTTGLVVNKLR